MKKSAAATLPDDVVVEILARVTDPAALFRCGTACRRWRALVVDPSFLDRRWPDNSHDLSCLLGFFVHRKSLKEEVEGILPNPLRSILPAPPSPLGPPHRFLGSRFHHVLDAAGRIDFSDHEMQPLASRRGLLLARLVPPTVREPGTVQLAVYNMFAGTCNVLPPLECDGFSYILCGAVLTSADCCPDDIQQMPSSSLPPHSPFFKVIIMGMGKLRYKLYVFSSCDASWRAPVECRNIPERRVCPLQMPRGTVVCQSKAHWLFVDLSYFYTLSVGVDTHQVSLEKVPLSVPPNTYAASRLSVGVGGTLKLLALRTQSLQLEIWTRENNGPQISDDAAVTTRWLCTQVIDIEEPKGSQINSVIWMYTGEKIGRSLRLANYWGTYMVDLETRTIIAEEVASGHICSLTYIRSVPFEMHWPTFFTSRLGTLRQGKINNHIYLLDEL
uniref:Uncharacterized protein n=1 Tax=Avena sativa TaxID=4498 RepID=A0ACD5T826_AVESA